MNTKITLLLSVGLLLLSQTIVAQSWVEKDLSNQLTKVNDIYFTSNQVGYLVATSGYSIQEGEIYKTTNGGLSWGSKFKDDNYVLSDIHFFDANNGIASATVGGLSPGVCRTSDAGENWSCETLSFGLLPRRLYFVNSNVGYLIGPHTGARVTNRILKTTDGGGTWTAAAPTQETEAIYGIHFVNANLGFAAGGNALAGNGKLFKTTDGGANWIEVFQDNDYTFWDVTFINETRGFLVGNGNNGGKMYKTTNGGTSWQEVNTPTVEIYRDVYFADSQNGYASGGAGLFTGSIVLKTTDAGEIWTEDYTTFFSSLTLGKIHYHQPSSKIYIASDDGYLTNTFVTSTYQVELADMQVSFNPNPATDKIWLDSQQSETLQLALFNNLGQQILQQDLAPGSSSLDVSGLARGTYYLNVLSAQQMSTTKIVIK